MATTTLAVTGVPMTAQATFEAKEETIQEEVVESGTRLGGHILYRIRKLA